MIFHFVKIKNDGKIADSAIFFVVAGVCTKLSFFFIKCSTFLNGVINIHANNVTLISISFANV